MGLCNFRVIYQLLYFEMEEESETVQTLFGTDYSKVPCFRQTFLYSIGSGLGAGLLNFLFTSRKRASINRGFGTYMCVTLGYWTYCRYNFSVQKFHSSQLQAAMNRKNVIDGTEAEDSLKNQ